MGRREKEKQISSEHLIPSCLQFNTNPAGWALGCLLLLGIRRALAAEVIFAPASGKLEFAQEGTLFNSRQHADLVFRVSLGPGLRTLFEIAHHIGIQAVGPRPVKCCGSPCSQHGDKGLKGPYHQANRDPQEDRQSYSGAALGGSLKKPGCRTPVPPGTYPCNPRSITPDFTFTLDVFSTHVHQQLQRCAEQVVEHLNHFHRAQQGASAATRSPSLSREMRQLLQVYQKI